MTQKAYDLVVKVGEYTDNQGQTKGRYENVGSVMIKDDGGKFIIMKRTFNPAGVPNPDNRDSLIVSLFEADKDRQQQAPAPQQQRQTPQQGGQYGGGVSGGQAQQRQAPQQQPENFVDDIPF